jgi:hypothetical protein
MRTRAINANALRSPRHPLCQARRWRRRARRARGRRHCAGPAFGLRRVHVPRRLVPSPVHVPRRGLFCHSGCVLRSHNPTICKACSVSGLVQAFRRPCIHSAALRRITYRGIVRSAAGAHFGRCQSVAREPTSPAASRLLNGNSSGATAPINKAPRPRPAPSFGAHLIPPRNIRDCFGSPVPSPGAPRVLSLRSFTGELPPAAQPARWPRASSPRRCAGGSARLARRLRAAPRQRRPSRRALRLRRAGRAKRASALLRLGGGKIAAHPLRRSPLRSARLHAQCSSHCPHCGHPCSSPLRSAPGLRHLRAAALRRRGPPRRAPPAACRSRAF